MHGPLVKGDQGSRPFIGYWPFALIYCFFFLCFFVDMVFIQGWSQMLIRPSLTLMCIFYCGIFRPNLLPFGLLFLMGFTYDAISGTYLGLHALIWMGAFWAIRAQRRFLLGQPFMMLWLVYAVNAAVAGLLSGRLGVGTIIAFDSGTLSLVGAFLVSLFFFPPVMLVLHMLHRQMPLNR